MEDANVLKTRVHPDFQPTSATDVVLRSTDNTLFYLEKDRLKYYCAGGFHDASEMTESSAPGSANPDMVDMTDADAKSLELLLQYTPTYPMSILILCSGHSEKHIVIRSIALCTSSQSVSSHSCVACFHHYFYGHADMIGGA
jgi:hypothetical protein